MEIRTDVQKLSDITNSRQVFCMYFFIMKNQPFLFQFFYQNVLFIWDIHFCIIKLKYTFTQFYFSSSFINKIAKYEFY